MITYTFEDGTTIRIDPLVVSQKIKSMLEEKHMSLQELADLTGISKSSLQRYSSGMTDKIPMDRIVQIAIKTHTSLFYLLGQTDIMEEEPFVPSQGPLKIVCNDGFTGTPDEVMAHKIDCKRKNQLAAGIFEKVTRLNEENLQKVDEYIDLLLMRQNKEK